MSRKQHIIKFGYPNLNTQVLTWMAERLQGKKVLEVGAGKGWLAYKLRKLGVEVIATDLSPNQENVYWGDRYSSFVEVVQISATNAIQEYNFDVLLVSWPCYREAWSYEALCALPPDKELLYIGEGSWGCCGTQQFFDKIYDLFGEGELCPYYVPFDGIHDDVIYYQVCKK